MGYLLHNYQKGIIRARANVGFKFIEYNLRRLMNIIDKNAFIKFLQELVFLFLRKKTLHKRFIVETKAFFLNIALLRIFYCPYRIAANIFIFEGRTDILRRTDVTRQ